MGAAARRPGAFAAIVSRGGRPDLVEPLLPLVRSPTLFIVGARDLPTMRLNEAAFACLGSARKHIALIENATHDFGEHGAMDEVARLAARWLNEHFV